MSREARAAAALARAHASLVAGERERALTAMLEAWAEVRAPALADTIERLSDVLVGQRPPLRGATLNEIDEDWTERAGARDRAELGVLLPAVSRTDSHTARRRLRALAKHAPDPRLATHLHALLLAPPYTASSTRKFWSKLIEVLSACADPRIPARERREGRERLDTAFGRELERRRARLVESMTIALAGLSVELDAVGQQQLAAITALLAQQRAARPQTGDELLAAVLAKPAQIERRRVYADYLLALGDPRGEFIALQLADQAGTLDRAGRARVRELLGTYEGRWLGELAWALTRGGAVFEAGFLTRAKLKRTLRDPAKLVGAPIWATVERVEHAPVDVLVDPVMRSLQSVACVSALAVALLERGVVLARVHDLSIGFERSWLGGAVSASEGFEPRFRALLEAAEVTPKLRSLTLSFDFVLALRQLEWIWSGPLARRLAWVELAAPSVVHLPVDACVQSLRRLGAALPELRLRLGGLRVRLVRGSENTRAWSRVELRTRGKSTREPLAQVRASLRWLDVELLIDGRRAE